MGHRRLTRTPAIWWVGRDLRLADNPALIATAASGPVLPVFVIDAAEDDLGAAAAWRLAQSAAALDADLRARGSRLIVRRGSAARVLAALMAETGAASVHLNSALPFFRVAKDVVAGLQVHPGNWLLPPGALKTGGGTPYRRFTPFWKALRGRDIAPPQPVPAFAAPSHWPDSLPFAEWGLGAGMNRGADVLAQAARIGETVAQDRLAEFLDDAVADYANDRDRPDRPLATSGLSDALAVGEISARNIWHAARAAFDQGAHGAETFLSELAWRDFARDLWHHAPDMDRQAWNPDWADFPWQGDHSGAQAWRQGLTGIDLVDAGMRELYATGRMHNRVRMVTASFLTKHLLTDWRVGLAWFADTLIDWDPASNAMNWQWVAGSGPDAAPYFRVFNPEAQAAKFDPQGKYRDYWLRGAGNDLFRAAIPRSWDIPPARPAPVVTLAEGRDLALAAYHAHRR